MARKSNKTAHVLNLLAGHDNNQPTADETPDTKPSAEAETVPPETPAPGIPAPAEPETAANAVPAQNISVIDTTGEDPVADLIQQKLSAQFEEPVSDVPDVSDNISEADEAPVKAADSAGEADSDVTAGLDIPVDSSEAPEASGLDDIVSQLDMAEAHSSIAEGQPAAADTGDTPDPADVAASYSMEAAADNVTVPTPEPAPAPDPISVPTPEPVLSMPVPDPESVPGPGPTTVSKQEAIPAPHPEPEPDFAYVNVMESIVKDKIIYFMRQFDVCTCDRCVADMIALTMNGLTPKYIVTSPAAVDPLISFYTNKLISDVTVEATKACIIVKDNPRH